MAAAAAARRPALLEPILAMLLAYVGYRLLSGELPHHDVARFAAQIRSDHFEWDIAHILLQPATLLWHRYLSFGGPAEESQRTISIVSTALAIGLLDALLLALRQATWRRICVCVLVATSYSIINLGPSGHMKLVAFPFLNTALLCLVIWEQRLRAAAAQASGGRGEEGWLVGAGVALALATGMLASALAAAPFVSLAILLVAHRAGASPMRAFGQATIFAATTGLLFIAIIVFGFVAFSSEPPTLAGVAAAVAHKASLVPSSLSLADRIGRLAFSTPNNLVAAPAVGSIVRAYMHGWIGSLRPYLGLLLVQGLPLLLAALLIAAIYLRGAWAVARGRWVAMPLAFLIGAQAWTIYYDLNDAEHWFALSVPTALLLVTTFPRRAVQMLLPLATLAVAGTGLGHVGLPVATYPLARYTKEIQAQFDPQDLIVGFAAYPGGAYIGLIDTPGVPRYKLDLRLQQLQSPDALLREMSQRIDATLDAGGRVVVFEVLDPLAWDAPWSLLYRRGLAKPKLYGFISDRYAIGPEVTIAELKVWRLTPKR